MTEQPTTANSQPRWWSRAILIGAVIAAVLLAVGALGTKFGIWPFTMGILFVFGAIILATIGFGGGFFAWLVARKNQLLNDRKLAGMGTIVSGLILALMAVQSKGAFTGPPIHNISTDVNDPPAFAAVLPLRGENSNPVEFNADELASLQADAYPWVKPLLTQLDQASATQRAADTLVSMGLELVSTDATNHLVEATHTSFWFGFKDDVVVRIRPAGDGSVIDVHSVSRVGESDLGQNARRIGEFFDGFEKG